MALTVAVLGAGRMGGFAANQLPKDVNKVIIDTYEEGAIRVAKEVGGTYSTSMEAAKDADVVLMVLPTPVIPAACEAMVKYAKAGAIIANMATTAVMPEEEIVKRSDVIFVDAKIIGHYTEMQNGSPSYVVVGTEDDKVFETLAGVLPGYTHVQKGDATKVSEISTIGSTEAIKVGYAIRKQLKKYNLPKDMEDVVINTVCVGTLKAFARDDLGPFARQIVEDLEKMEAEK